MRLVELGEVTHSKETKVKENEVVAEESEVGHFCEFRCQILRFSDMLGEVSRRWHLHLVRTSC